MHAKHTAFCMPDSGQTSTLLGRKRRLQPEESSALLKRTELLTRLDRPAAGIDFAQLDSAVTEVCEGEQQNIKQVSAPEMHRA